MQLSSTFRQQIKSVILSRNNALRAAFLFGFASLSSWMPMFNLWLETNGLSGIQIGVIAAIPWLLMLVIQPFWGMLADKYGKLLCLKISLIGALLLFILFPFVKSGVVLIAAMTIALSLFNTPVLPFLDSIALDQVESKHINSYSTIRFWGAIGYALGASFTGWLISIIGVQAAFFSSGGFLLLCYLSALKIINVEKEASAVDVEFKYLGKIISNKILLIFLFIIVIVSISQSAITFFLALYMKQIGASSETTGMAIGMEGISELPFYFIAAWLLQSMAPGKVVFMAIIATAVRLFLYSINDNPNLVIFIEAMNGMTWTLLWVSSVEFVNSLVPAKFRTTGQSMLWAAYFGAGAVLGNILSGWMYQFMPMKQVYSTNALMILLTGMLALYIFFFRNTKQTSAT
jgi:MFS transporter, PPP family, 3-phenylpropionic acid transporter